MPSLTEILKDPNYVNANEATKRAIFNKYSAQDQNFAGANDATKNAIRQRFGIIEAPVEQAAPNKEPETGFIAGIRSGYERLKGDVGAIGATAGVEGAEEYAAKQRKKAGEIYKQPEFTERPIDYVTGLLGQSLPYMVAPIAAAAVAPAGLLAMGAAGAASAAQFTGANISRQLEEGVSAKDAKVVNAMAASVPQAALDVIGFKFMPAISKLFSKAGTPLTEQAATSILGKYILPAAKTAGVEGATEAGQQVLERAQAGLSITDEEARKEYFDSFVGGAILGGAISIPGGAIERARAKSPVETLPPEEKPVAERPAEAAPQAPAEPPEIITRPPKLSEAPKPPEDAVAAMQNYFEGKPEDFGLSFADIQNRDRSRPNSIGQMNDIANRPDYNKLSVSREFGAGAPVVISDVPISEEALGRIDTVSASDGSKFPIQYAVIDAREITPSNRADGSTVAEYADPTFEGIRPVAGNGRVAGLQKLYAVGPYGDYVNPLLQDTEHGIDASVIAAIEQPVLVRIMPKSSLVPNIADISNVRQQLGMSPTEQAKVDMGRFDLQGIEFLADGSPSIRSLRQFVATMPKEEQAELINKSGQPNPLAKMRLSNALFARAYENDALIDLFAETTDPEAQQILKGMAIAAPAMSNLSEAGDYDIRRYVTKAAEMAVNARRQNKDLAEFIEQGDIELDPLTREIVSMFAANKNAPRRVGDSLTTLAAEANKAAEQATAEPDMFGNVAVSTPLEDVFAVLRSEPTTKAPIVEEKKLEEIKGTAAEKTALVINKDPEHARIEKELTGRTMLQAAQWAVDNAPNQFAKAIAQKVSNRLNGMAKRGIKLEFEVTSGDRRPLKMSAARGLTEYDFGKRGEQKMASIKITLNGAAVVDNQRGYPPGTRYITVLHELLHAATVGQINVLKGDDPIVKELRDLFNKVVTHFNTEVRAGRLTPFMEKVYAGEINPLTGPDELVAWGIADRDMQEFLSEIKVGDKTMMDKLVELIRKILNITKPYLTALDQLVKTTESILDENVDVVGEKIIAKQYSFGVKPGAEPVQGALFEQGRDTRTPEFRKWFGKSKVVDENGEPLVVYHGTTSNITEFRKRALGTNTLAKSAFGGFFFTNSPENAAEYSIGTAVRRTGLSAKDIIATWSDADRKEYAEIKNYRDSLKPKGARTDSWMMTDEWRNRNRMVSETFDRLLQKNDAGANVMPVYLSIKNPLEYDMKGSTYRDKSYADIIAEARKQGRDGVIIRNTYDPLFGDVYVAFDSNQIKSVFNKRPTEAAGILQEQAEAPKTPAQKAKAAAQKALQKRTLKKSQFDGVPDDLYSALEPIFAPEKKTIIDKIDGMRDGFFMKLAQGVADQYRSIKDISEEAYMKARMSKTIDGALEGILFNGQVKLTDGALDIAPKTKGLMQVLEPVGNEVDRYQIWVALQRDAQLVAQGKAPSVNKDVVARRNELSAGKIGNKSRLEVYKQVQKDMNKLNQSVLKIAKEQGIIDEEAYKVYARDINYIPFYKMLDENSDVQAAATQSGLVNQYFSKALKGGEKPFGDLMENTLRNWSHILSASMKNEAANATIKAAMKLDGAYPNLKVGLDWIDGKVYSSRTGEMVGDGSLKPEYTTSGKGTVKTVIDGKPAYFDVKEPLLLESIMSIGYMGPKSKFLEVARGFKNMLQFGVTLSPAFKIRNLIRDSVSAMAVTDLKKNPFANVIQGWAASDRNNPAHISALAGGAVFNFGSYYEGDQAKLIKRLLDKGVPTNTILDTPEKIKKASQFLWNKYQEWGNKSESANRMALYKQLKEQGYSHLEASFYARDMLDFSMQGSWPAFRFLTQVVPFLNARVQGLYKLGRDGLIPTSRVIYNTATGKPIEATDKQRAEQFSIIMSAVALASLALYMAFKDDDEFKKREQWDRDNFWWFKLPGMDQAYRIPKPFEVGAFGTIAERVAEQIFDQGVEGKVFKESLARMLTDTFAVNLPQVAKPLVDLYANKDSFTGAPIETAGMERLSKAQRIAEKTSPLAIGLSEVANVFLPESKELSPVQTDYTIKAFFGWLGSTASWLSHYAVMPFSKSAYPDNNWTETLSMGFIKSLPATQSKYVTAFYENNKEISQAYADMRHFAQLGQADKVQEILKEKGDKIAMAKFYDNASKDMAKMRQAIQAIRNDENMTGAQKKEEIDRMKIIIGEIAKQMEDARIMVKKQYDASQ